MPHSDPAFLIALGDPIQEAQRITAPIVAGGPGVFSLPEDSKLSNEDWGFSVTVLSEAGRIYVSRFADNVARIITTAWFILRDEQSATLLFARGAGGRPLLFFASDELAAPVAIVNVNSARQPWRDVNLGLNNGRP